MAFLGSFSVAANLGYERMDKNNAMHRHQRIHQLTHFGKVNARPVKCRRATSALRQAVFETGSAQAEIEMTNCTEKEQWLPFSRALKRTRTRAYLQWAFPVTP